MSGLAQRLALEAGVEIADVTLPAPGSRRAGGVPASAELDRVLALPRRQWWRGLGGRHGTASEVRDLLTAHFRRPDARPDARLRLVQSAALQEAYDFGGAAIPIAVGGGKTLVSLLAPVLLEAERPILLVPGSLRDKTRRDAEDYARDWLVPELAWEPEEWAADPRGRLLVLSYDRLSRDHLDAASDEDADRRALGLLAELRPDLLALDEAQAVANRKARRTRCLSRYVERTRRAGGRLVVLVLTGTITRQSLREFHHLLVWSLRDGAPVPRPWHVAAAWGEALDEDSRSMTSVGALARLCGPDEQASLLLDPRAACRRAFGRRLVETPGVIAASPEDEVDARLVVRAAHLELGPAIRAALRGVRSLWELPDGRTFCQASDQWRHVRELACGFFYRWTEEPPDEWREARRDWHAHARRLIQTNRRGIDTEVQLVRAIDRGELDPGPLARWREVRDTFEPETEAVWISDEVVEFAAAWLAEHPRGLCWVQHGAVGERLSEISGVPYFRNEGRARIPGRRWLLYVEDHEGPAVVSVQANHRGRNLQYGWCDSLILTPIRAGDVVEQVLGRTHRSGQEEDEVCCWVRISCSEHLETWVQALGQAEFIGQTSGVPQKLITGDVEVGPPDPIPPGW